MNVHSKSDEVLREKVKIAANGRMVLPKSMRDAVGITGEAELTLTIKDGQIQISTMADRIREAREIFRRTVKRPFTSDDFLATRERD
jgi:AbrB family looped-hinge helix DNA binding protein